jgi:hypothetical protein
LVCPFRCGNLYTGSLVEHKNTHFNCVFGQKIPMGILSILSFMIGMSFFFFGKQKTNLMLTRKLETNSLKICYHGRTRPFSTKKPQFCSNNHAEIVRRGPCKAKLTSNKTFFKLNFAPNLLKFYEFTLAFYLCQDNTLLSLVLWKGWVFSSLQW